MRRIFGLLTVAAILTSVFLSGCDKDKVVWVKTNMPDSTYFPKEGDSISFRLQSNGMWDFYNQGLSWIKIKPSVPLNPDKTDTTVWIVVGENLSRFERKVTLTLKWGASLESSKSIVIDQERGPERLYPLSFADIKIPFNEERMYIGFGSNVHIDITEYPDWMTHKKGDFYTSLYETCDPALPFSSCQMVKCDSTVGQNIYALFTFNRNVLSTQPRAGKITAKWIDGDLSASVNVIQSGATDDYFDLQPIVTPYESVKSGLNAGDQLSREITIHSVFSDFDYALTDANENPITWVTFAPAPTRSGSVGTFNYTLQFTANHSGVDRGAILRVWPKSNQSLGQSLQFLQSGK